MDSLFPRDNDHNISTYEAGIEMVIGEEPDNLAVNNYVLVYLSPFSYMLTDMLIGLLPVSGAIKTMEHYRREIEYIAMTRILFITRNFLLSPRVETIINRQLDELRFLF